MYTVIGCRECNAIQHQAESFDLGGKCPEHGIVKARPIKLSELLPDEYLSAIAEMAKELDMTWDQLIRHAIRSFQLEHEKRMGRYVEMPPVGLPAFD